MDPITHAHIGNYPQALTHSALVRAALAAVRASRRSETSERPAAFRST